jgi:hypothetical protein
VENCLKQYATLLQIDKKTNEAESEKKDNVTTAVKQEAPMKRNRASKMPGSPSCADRIRALIDESYFTQTRSANDIQSYLKDQKGAPYNTNQITAALAQILRSGKLRRIKEEGVYKYINP